MRVEHFLSPSFSARQSARPCYYRGLVFSCNKASGDLPIIPEAYLFLGLRLMSNVTQVASVTSAKEDNSSMLRVIKKAAL